jgi:hypothetical protein
MSTETLPVPNSFLSIEGDPTPWGLTDLAQTVVPQLTAGQPVALEVVTPLAGTLLLSPRRAGSLVLVPSPPGGGWVPCVRLPSLYLYLPSTAGLTAHSPGHVLAGPDADRQAVQHKILTAMSRGTACTVSISTGTVVIHAAQLTFAVLADAERTA